jgi:Trm5-related predicted tRNA methylase
VSKDPRDVQDIFMNGECGDGSSSDADAEAVPPSKVVYLSPDAEEALTDVESNTVYVIGGIVDLAARGIAWSLPRANAVGATARRLPIREHLPNVTNQILNIDTAMKVLCEKYSGKEWVDALESALPKRQQGERPARFNRPQKKSIEDLQSAEM